MRVLVVYCHPRPDSLGAAALARVLAGLERGGHDVEVRDLYEMGFEPVLTLDEQRPDAAGGTRGDVRSEIGALEGADALVFVYPTWWGGQPAMLKGWLDRVLVAGGAYPTPVRDLEGVSLRGVRKLLVVTTHGSSKLVNTLQGEPGKRVLLRGLRPLLGLRARCRWVAAYGVDRSSAADRQRFLDRVERAADRI